MVQVSYPGVYIEEFAPAPPIEPASTSVAAFIGVAPSGEIDEPTRITSFNQFMSVFGRNPLNGFYLWYAVRGFFENGGNDCFVVRASNGRYARATLSNGKDPVIRVRTLQPGKPDPTIAVSVTRSHRISAANGRVFNVTGVVANIDERDPVVTLGEVNNNPSPAFLFRAGDVVVASNGGRATVRSVDSFGGRLTLDRQIDGLKRDDTLTLASVQANERSVRIELLGPDGKDMQPPPQTLIAGTMLTLDPGNAGRVTGIIDTVENEFLTLVRGEQRIQKTTYRVTFRDTFGKTLDRTGGIPIQSEEFDLKVKPGVLSEKVYNFLTTDPLHPRFAADYVSNRGAESDALIRIEMVDPPPPGDLLNLLPADGANVTLGATVARNTEDDEGASEDLAAMFTQPNEFIEALGKLAKVPEVNVVAIPDAVALKLETDRTAVQQAIIAHCENMAERFGVLDASAADQDPFVSRGDDKPSIQIQRGKLVSPRGYAGLYYPWLRVLPATRGPLVSVPPSGHICGLLARVDRTRGVHKAPANEPLRGAPAITRDMTNEEQGVLNLEGINVIRTFTSGGQPIVFGARTTASDLNWQYVNIRRLFLHIEESISKGLRSSVFEPNTTELWERLKRVITAFLLDKWQSGALFGEKADKAFYVKIDEALNPFSEQSLGRLHIEIGVRPSFPAEFIIVRIGIWDGGSSVSEG